MTSPWVKRAQEEARGTRRHAVVKAEPTLGDAVRADIRLSDAERQLQDAYIHGQAVAAARMRG